MLIVLHCLSVQPQYKTVLLPPVLMYNLCKGNFSEFNSLLQSYSGQFPYLYYKTNFRTIASEILKNVDIKEFDKISIEASKIFDSVVVNNILSNVIVEAIIAQSGSDSRDRVVEIVKLAEVHFYVVWDLSMRFLDVPEIQCDVQVVRNREIKLESCGTS